MDKSLMRLENARVPKQAEQMKNIEEMGICPFCREHFEQNHKAPILWESRYWLVAHNDYPYEGTRVHLLIVSKQHIEHISEMSFCSAMDLVRLFRWMTSEFSMPGGSFLMRYGDMEYTGATIAHLHAHVVVGGHKGDGSESLKVKVGFKTNKNTP